MYEPAGRRDPFVSLLSRGIESGTGQTDRPFTTCPTSELVLRGVMQSRNTYVALLSGPDGKTYSGTCERSPSRWCYPKCDPAGHRHHAGRQRPPLAGETARSAKRTQDSGRWQITFYRRAYVRMGGALLLLLAGLWAAGLTPLDAFGPPLPRKTRRRHRG